MRTKLPATHISVSFLSAYRRPSPSFPGGPLPPLPRGPQHVLGRAHPRSPCTQWWGQFGRGLIRVLPAHNVRVDNSVEVSSEFSLHAMFVGIIRIRPKTS
jgi:hypothetical protein